MMIKNILLMVLVSIPLLFVGCGGSKDSNDDNTTEEKVENHVEGTVMENVHVLEEEHFISSYYEESENYEESKNILILKKNTEAIEVGDTVVFGITKDFPYGMIGKVIEKEENNNSVKLVTVPGTLSDVFKDLDLTYSMDLNPDYIIYNDSKNIGSGKAIYVFQEEKGVKLSLKKDRFASVGEVPALASKNHGFTIDFDEVDMGEDVTLNGSLSFSLSFHLKIKFHTECEHKKAGICYSWKTELGHTYFYIEPEESGQVTLSATKDHSIDKSKTLAEYSFSPIDIQVGAVPVVIVPKLKFNADLNGDVSAGMSMGFEQDASFKLGLTHKKTGSEYKWHSIKSENTDFEMISPQFDTSASVKLSAGPELDLLIYDMVGPHAHLETYLEGDVDLNSDPWWMLYAGVDAYVSFHLKVVHHDFADIYYQLFDYKKVIGKAK